jgi:ABC-type Na+ efflux pump permease subunit
VLRGYKRTVRRRDRVVVVVVVIVVVVVAAVAAAAVVVVAAAESGEWRVELRDASSSGYELGSRGIELSRQ